MAFIDVLTYRGPENALVWHWEPEASRWGRRQDELRLGTQLVVGPSMIAVFVKGGQIADIFAPGTYTLSTKNLPILDRLVALPFGKESPFKAEVYYINKAAIMDTRFSIPPFNMLDQNFKIPVPLRCNGSFAVRVGEARQFLTRLFGALRVLTPDTMREYFRGVIIENVKTSLARIAKSQQLGPMELEACVGDLSAQIFSQVASTMEGYGIHLELLNIEGVSIIDDDPRVKKAIDEYQRIMSEDMAERMRLKRRGENLEVYRTERSFDTTEAAANSMGHGAGDNGVMGTVVGMGMAQPMAGAMANVMQSALNQYPQVNPQYSNPQAQQPQNNSGGTTSKDEILKTIRDLDALRKAGALTEEEFAEKKRELLSKI